MRCLRKGKRRGATTLFLAIVLSAVILVECTYIGLVEELRCNMAYTRGVKLQVETYLSDYDRQLFKTYGIYAFDINTVDSDVFNMILEGSGIEEGSEIYVCGVNSFDTDDLKDAISLYYSYRTSGVMVSFITDYLFEVIETIDEYGVLDKIRSFMNSGASDVMMDIIDGAVSFSEEVLEYASQLGISDIDSYIDGLSEFIDIFDQLDNDGPDVGGSYSPRDMEFGIDTVTGLYDMFDNTADMISGPLFHGFAVNYASYNFDSSIDDDTALDGTSFTAFHAEESTDTEYILTGISGREGAMACALLIFQFSFVVEFINIEADPEMMEWINGIGEVLSVLIEIASLGTVVIPVEFCSAVIVMYIAQNFATRDTANLLSGENITLAELGDLPAVTIGYRDILSIYMNLVPDSLLLSRMNEILTRDFPGYVCGISVGTGFNDVEITYSRTYCIYGVETYE